MKRTHEIRVRLNADELAQLDEQRPDGMTRASWLRELARRPGRIGETPTRDQVLEVLWRMSRDGKVQAAVCLARELREEAGDVPKGALSRLLDG